MGKLRPSQAKGHGASQQAWGFSTTPGNVGCGLCTNSPCLVQFPMGKPPTNLKSAPTSPCDSQRLCLSQRKKKKKKKTEFWASGTKREMNNVFPCHKRIRVFNEDFLHSTELNQRAWTNEQTDEQMISGPWDNLAACHTLWAAFLLRRPRTELLKEDRT